MSEVTNCVLCDTPLGELEESASRAAAVHRECALRSALGGIGHLLDHRHFCREGGAGPDAGLDYRTSSLLVDELVAALGVEVASEMSTPRGGGARA